MSSGEEGIHLDSRGFKMTSFDGSEDSPSSVVVRTEIFTSWKRKTIFTPTHPSPPPSHLLSLYRSQEDAMLISSTHIALVLPVHIHTVPSGTCGKGVWRCPLQGHAIQPAFDKLPFKCEQGWGQDRYQPSRRRCILIQLLNVLQIGLASSLGFLWGVGAVLFCSTTIIQHDHYQQEWGNGNGTRGMGTGHRG